MCADGDDCAIVVLDSMVASNPYHEHEAKKLRSLVTNSDQTPRTYFMTSHSHPLRTVEVGSVNQFSFYFYYFKLCENRNLPYRCNYRIMETIAVYSFWNG
jgi:hypothetical protein